MSGMPLVTFSLILWYPLHSKNTCSQYEFYGRTLVITIHIYVGCYPMKQTCIPLQKNLDFDFLFIWKIKKIVSHTFYLFEEGIRNTVAFLNNHKHHHFQKFSNKFLVEKKNNTAKIKLQF